MTVPLLVQMVTPPAATEKVQVKRPTPWYACDGNSSDEPSPSPNSQA